MPQLLSGSKYRTGGSGQFLKLADAMPQLPQSPTTSTGYTVITSDKLVTTYTSSLGNIQFYQGQIYSNIDTQTLTLIGTGTTAVVITSNNTQSSTGTLVVQGGVSVSKDFFIGGSLIASTTTFYTLAVTSNQNSTSTTTGALTVSGGVGIGLDTNIGGKLTVASTATVGDTLYAQGDVFVNGQLSVTGIEGVTLSPQAASVVIKPTLGGTIDIEPSLTGNLNNTVVGYSVARDGYFQTVHASNTTVTNTVWAGGSVYSQDGIAEYNNLLYTPKTTISTTAPLNPRVGDFWINPTYGVECQYINDGGNHIWIQFTGF
jgi:hypothetical protein